MKRVFWIAITILGTLWFSSCEDVIEVDLPDTDRRLVIDGLIRVDTTQEFVDVKVKVTETSSFFGNISPISNLSSIFIFYGIENEFGEITSGSYSNLAEVEVGSGIYVPDPNFSSDQRIRTEGLNSELTFWLFIDYEDRRYAAKTQYTPSVKIDNLIQGDGTLFNEEDTEVVLFYTDTPDLENYYVFDFDFGNFITSEDTFDEGQPFNFSYFYEEGLEPGQEVKVSIIGADQTFYNYMNLLLEQSEGGFGPFETPVATIRGNIFDVTGIDNINQFDNVEQPDNYPLGYFSVSETFTQTLTIE